MKIAIAASLLATATAFAPTQQSARSVTSVHASAELESMIGVGPETGNKIVSVACFVEQHFLLKISKISLLFWNCLSKILQFDPVGLAQWAPADFLRKAELSVRKIISDCFAANAMAQEFL